MKNKTLTKSDIVEALYEKLGYTKQYNKGLVDSTFEMIEKKLLEGMGIKIYGFGKFVLKDKKTRVGRNPQTGQAVTIPARRVLSFSPSFTLRKRFKGEA